MFESYYGQVFYFKIQSFSSLSTRMGSCGGNSTHARVVAFRVFWHTKNLKANKLGYFEQKPKPRRIWIVRMNASDYLTRIGITETNLLPTKGQLQLVFLIWMLSDYFLYANTIFLHFGVGFLFWNLTSDRKFTSYPQIPSLSYSLWKFRLTYGENCDCWTGRMLGENDH